LSVLRLTAVRDGRWQLAECAPAWEDNGTWDGFIAFSWQGPDGSRLLVTVNYAGTQGQCYVRLSFGGVAGQPVRFTDRMGPAIYDRQGSDVVSRGLYLDLPAWGYHVFDVK
jgi:hypothetical protein